METVGNSLGRAPLRRSDAEATTRWTERKPWEIAWGELLWEGARRKRRQGGRKGNRRKYSLGKAPLGGRDILRSRAVGTGFQDKFYQLDRPENCAPKTFQAVCKHWAMGHAYSFVGKGRR